MLKTIIKKGFYQDSVVLMLLTNQISSLEGVKRASVMMATPANKEIIINNGLPIELLRDAGANDMAIVVEADTEEVITSVEAEIIRFLNNQEAVALKASEQDVVKNWDQAMKLAKTPSLAVISIPGAYAVYEAHRALDEDLNVFLFSDNITVEDEIRLKKRAGEKGLLVMGSDCGTSVLGGVPIAFANKTRPGRVGIIGASGTGIQEVISVTDHLGEGIACAVGTGGRDLEEGINARTMLAAIEALDENPDAEVLVIISKPPSPSVRDMVMKRLRMVEKPVVTLFQGENPAEHEEGFYHASTLAEAAETAVRILRGEADICYEPERIQAEDGFPLAENRTIKGIYCGGSLAEEAAMLIKEALRLSASEEHKEGYKLLAGGNQVVDLGDDVHTKGKPHPMLDPKMRIPWFQKAANDPSTGVILFDVILGYGSHPEMTEQLLEGIMPIQELLKKKGRKIFFVASLCGTQLDPQGYDHVKKLLELNDIIVCGSNCQAVATATEIIGFPCHGKQKTIVPKIQEASVKHGKRQPKVKELLSGKPSVINIGLKDFSRVLREYCDVIQFDWTPPAGGDLKMADVLRFLRQYRFESQGEVQDGF